MTSNLHAASSQWAKRPADERFWTLREMRTACESVHAGCATSTRPFGDMRAVAVGDDVLLNGPSGNPARLTHYAFGQVAGAAGAPAGYLRELPAVTAAECLNAGLAKRTDDPARDLLFFKNGGLTLRACLSNRYERVWDNELCSYLERLEGWRPPAGRTPPGYDGPSRLATAEDILPGQINIAPGTPIAPSGLYASDHDMFAFLVAPDCTIDDGSGGALMRGVFVKNSEVGDASLSVTCFLMQAVCGNHIVWGAKNTHEIRIRHVGRDPLRRAMRGLEVELRRYHDGAPEEERMIVAARKHVLGGKKEDVLDALVKYVKGHSLPLSRGKLSEAYDVAADHTDWYGAPNTVWGMVAGLTHASQTTGYADDRATIDRAAGKLLEIVDF